MKIETVLERLVDVDVTQAWAHETNEFTPWLGANIDRLSAALNMPLEFVDREVQIVGGRYKADILALNPVDGHNVLIENQLYQSDHGHIGQILTYLAGLNAKTIVWIAPKFREEHRSAIRWLNQNTHDDISFFAVQLRVVRIANSPLAPLFDVLEQPNNWDRGVQRIVAEKTALEQGWRQRFWQKYVEKYPDAGTDRGGGGHGSSRWRTVPDSDLIISRWVGEGSVGVFIRGERGVHTPDVYEQLSEHADLLERKLGVSLGENEWYPFIDEQDFDVSIDAQANRAIEWLEQQTCHFVKVIQQYSKEND